MQGDDVFSFAISVLPRDIEKLLDYTGKSISDMDLFAFHQANNFIPKYIAKKAKVEKKTRCYIPSKNLEIPMEHRYLYVYHKGIDKTKKRNTLLMNAISFGFTYGTVMINLVDCNIIGVSKI